MFSELSASRCVGLGFLEAFEKYNPNFHKFTFVKLPKSDDLRVVKYKGRFFCLEVMKKILKFFKNNITVAIIIKDAHFLVFKMGKMCIVLGEKEEERQLKSIEEEFDWNEIFTEIKKLSNDMVI